MTSLARLQISAAAAVAITLVLTHSTSARAEEPATHDEVRPSAFQLDLATEAGFFGRESKQWGPSFGLGVLIGVGRRLSVGARASFLSLDAAFVNICSGITGCGSSSSPASITSAFHIDVELRYHPFLTRVVDTWFAGDVGVGQVATTEIASSSSTNGTAGPHVGCGAGIDVHPFPAVSVGVAARAGMSSIGLPSGGGTSTYGDASLGLVLAFHVPRSTPPAKAVAIVE